MQIFSSVPKTADGDDTYVLCEINASCITPFPPEAPAKIAARAVHMLARKNQAVASESPSWRQFHNGSIGAFHVHRSPYVHSHSTFIAGAVAAGAAIPSATGAESPSAGTTVGAVYEVKPLPIDPAKVQGLSAKLLISHHDNNYAGAVKRLNAISTQLAGLDWATARLFS